MKEQAIQREVFRHLKARKAKGVVAFHPMNGGIHQRGRRRAINAGMGVLSGVPDVALIKGGKMFFLELKAENGKIAEKQIEIMRQLNEAGATCAVAWGLNEALAWLESHDLLVGKAA